MHHDQTAHDTLWDLIKDIKFGMFTHQNALGELHAHPLTTQNQSVDENATLYFFIQLDSEIATAVATQPQVCVTYSDPSSDSYVSASGTAGLENNQAKKDELFSDMAKAWFPAGPSDPNLALLVVRLRHAQYWKTDSGKTVQLLKMVKAAVTGDSPPDLGHHKEINL